MAGKRRFGAVRKLPSGRWQARYLGPDGVMRPADETFATKGEADQWLVKKEAEILAGEWIDPDAGKVLVSAFAVQWVAERPKMRPTTRKRSSDLIRLHIVPYLGAKPIGEIKPSHIRTWHKQLTDHGVGAATIARSYQLLKAIFATAVDDDSIRRNPCRIEGAAVYTAKERPVLSIGQVFAIADNLPDRYRALVLLGTFAGLRWGELVGLKRECVDLEACTVRVETTVVELNGSTLLLDQPPKSEAGRRVVSFPAYLRPVLEAHLTNYTGEASTSYVFTSPKGAVLRRSNFRPVWVKALAAVGLTGVRVHDLRHTGATIAAQTGATLKELMNRIGHSTARAAINYQHAADGRDQEIAAALDKLIKKEQRKGRASKRRGTRKPPEA